MARYLLGGEFPREAFVQAAVEAHFATCERTQVGHADFACTDADGNRWLIEAKGETSDVGLDFRTGLGQLVQGPPDDGWLLALAMPDTPKFAYQRARTPAWIRRALRLHWMTVSSNGELRIEAPDP